MIDVKYLKKWGRERFWKYRTIYQHVCLLTITNHEDEESYMLALRLKCYMTMGGVKDILKKQDVEPLFVSNLDIKQFFEYEKEGFIECFVAPNIFRNTETWFLC